MQQEPQDVHRALSNLLSGWEVFLSFSQTRIPFPPGSAAFSLASADDTILSADQPKLWHTERLSWAGEGALESSALGLHSFLPFQAPLSSR